MHGFPVLLVALQHNVRCLYCDLCKCKYFLSVYAGLTIVPYLCLLETSLICNNCNPPEEDLISLNVSGHCMYALWIITSCLMVYYNLLFNDTWYFYGTIMFFFKLSPRLFILGTKLYSIDACDLTFFAVFTKSIPFPHFLTCRFIFLF